MDDVRFLNPQALFSPPGYSHVVEVSGPGRIVYIAGQAGLDRSFRIVGGLDDPRAQIIQAFENLKEALAAVDAKFENVVKVNVYLTALVYLKVYREIRDQYFSVATPPASTLVVVSKLAVEGLMFEIEAVAALPSK